MKLIYAQTTLLIVLCCALSASGDGPDGDQANPISTKAAQVLKQVSGVIGLRDRSGAEPPAQVEQITASASSTPELSPNRAGASVWQVKTEGIHLDLKRWTDLGQRQKQFTTYFDSVGQVPLGVFGVCADCAAGDSVSFWESKCLARLWSAVQDSDLDPEEPPKVSFLEALDQSFAGSPAQAIAVAALYVDYSCQGSEERPAWVIEVNGFQPAMARAGFSGYRQWSFVVDAITGETIFTASAPCTSVSIHFGE